MVWRDWTKDRVRVEPTVDRCDERDATAAVDLIDDDRVHLFWMSAICY